MLNRSFHGSRNVLGVLCVGVIIGLFMTLSGEGNAGMMFMSTLAWAGIAYLYWRIKSK
jgi:hypothetical protein